MSRYLAPYEGVLADVHAPLIALYRAVREGWMPPETVTRDDYVRAKNLPDSDPMKAFAGFSCSFGARYFAGYSIEHFTHIGRNPLRANARDLRETIPRLHRFDLQCMSFLDASPDPRFGVVYCDPPYAGTQSYAGSAPLDHKEFWAHCQRWATVSAVFVSEYQCPVNHEIALEHSHYTTVGPARRNEARVERLFRVLP